MIRLRYYTGNADSKIGDIVEVFGWYDAQEWVKVRLVRFTQYGFEVEPV